MDKATVAKRAMTTTTAAPGLAVAATDPIRSFLLTAAASVDLAADLRDLASGLISDPAVTYRALRTIWCVTPPDTRPQLRDLLQGADFVLPSPKPVKSDQLKARLEKLREIQERKEYAELVRDVAPPSKDDAPVFNEKEKNVNQRKGGENTCFQQIRR
ncbi:uncharacterized protein [Miscanthus floridulus]|uniref:uncharacterized protein n=1 Tax=Miscanthus floridulus TaxID=154761 RepID=UPI00345A0F51